MGNMFNKGFPIKRSLNQPPRVTEPYLHKTTNMYNQEGLTKKTAKPSYAYCVFSSVPSRVARRQSRQRTAP